MIMLSEGTLFDLLRESLRVAVGISAPILGAALVTGVSIGLLQALTSVQEMTLTFVPKLMAMFAVFWVSMSFMTQKLVDFFQTVVVPSISGN